MQFKNKNSKLEGLIAGIYDKRPPKPKHIFIWHAEVFPKYQKNTFKRAFVTERGTSKS